uniref:Uncharacterized protein n=1 Tax=Biomphalaria glabrata TaxID=6526 RepID=A0A2C9KJN6_BIOGL
MTTNISCAYTLKNVTCSCTKQCKKTNYETEVSSIEMQHVDMINQVTIKCSDAKQEGNNKLFCDSVFKKSFEQLSSELFQVRFYLKSNSYTVEKEILIIDKKTLLEKIAGYIAYFYGIAALTVFEFIFSICALILFIVLSSVCMSCKKLRTFRD